MSIAQAESLFSVGELRRTSAGNIFRLEEFDGVNSCLVRRVGIVGQPDRELWDADMTYRWSFCQWESIPLLGADTSDYPFFGKFIGQFNSIPYWAQQAIDAHKQGRDKAAANGHDVSRISIGYYDGVVKICDDDGAFEQRLGQGGNVSHSRLGYPSRALESVFYHRR
jgi:hypothetical protein